MPVTLLLIFMLPRTGLYLSAACEGWVNGSWLALLLLAKAFFQHFQ